MPLVDAGLAKRAILAAGVSAISFIAGCAPPVEAPPKTQSTTDATAASPSRRTWTIDSAEREALVTLPAKPSMGVRSPVVFIFHGHGGNSAQVRRSYDAERHWPEAIFVYPQGLKTPGALTDPDGRRSGWQPIAGMLGDRDLKFFDAMLATVTAELGGDPERVFVTGHSNGGGFTYLLWSARGNRLAAVAPSSAYARRGINLPPLPAMHVAQRNDPLVTFDRQERTMAEIRALNGCDPEGSAQGDRGTLYPSPKGTPVFLWISDGTHKFDSTCVGPMFGFFRLHRRTPG